MSRTQLLNILSIKQVDCKPIIKWQLNMVQRAKFHLYRFMLKT